MSTRKEYYILPGPNGWRIRLDNTDYHYATQALAIAAARQHAVAQFALGVNSQIHVQNAHGKWRTEWTYGNDPKRYPG